MEDLASQRFLDDILRLYITPEIERRTAAKLIPSPFVLWGAQVIMSFEKPVEIRLNDEVKAQMKCRYKHEVKIGTQIDFDNIEEILDVDARDTDPDAGHITVVFHGGRCYMRFDLRYNAARIKGHLEAAREFLSCATCALERGHLRAFVDNLFSAAELIAKGTCVLSTEIPWFNHRFFPGIIISFSLV
jgi:hypothetical protein